ncbi:MAG: RES family NAD+ phosphorylase [Erythrobacter sp.]|nr:RES family NAD+ phosphorylase [Erythrobacter sp.]
MAKVPRAPLLKHLKSLTPAKHALSRRDLVWRIYYRGGHHPTTWRDFRHVGPVDARFDHHLGKTPTHQDRAVMYLADDPLTCLAEVFQKTRVINRWHKDPWLVAFRIDSAVPLLDLTGTFASQAGASMGLMSGARSVSRNWARGFYDAYTDLAGLYYPASMHANRPAIALTDRAEAAGVIPAHPELHRGLSDPAVLTVLRNAARSLGYALN